MAKMKIEAKDRDLTKLANEVVDTTVKDFIGENYLPYAYYVILNRALIGPDGLKPVNRRLLYTLYRSGATPTKPHIKAAKVASNTSGELHPHGDASGAAALTRMAQAFNMRVPLIDAHGDVGVENGDEGAAPRYWEARLTPASMELLKEIKENACDMVKNYDGTLDEPVQLPIRWANGIINGSSGIAVGYSCTILPHNPTEVMKAIVETIKNPNITTDELLQIMPGPDFPTGGTLIGNEGVREYFETGKGSFAVRGKYRVEPLPRGAHLITFDELPYQVAPEKILQDIKKARSLGKLKGVTDAQNYSEMGTPVNFIVKLKAGVNPTLVLNELFKVTSLQQTFSSNMTVLRDGKPELVSMKGLIDQFIEQRIQCVVRKSNYKLAENKKSVERLQGILSVVVDIDKAIEIIKGAQDTEVASTELMKYFKINEDQASYILSMPLRRLTKSDTVEIKEKIETLSKECEELELILNDSKVFEEFLISELEDTTKIIADNRRTVINTKSAEEIAFEERETRKAITQSSKSRDCFITLFETGHITKTIEEYTQREKPLPIKQVFKTKTLEDVIVIMKDGSGVRVPATYIHENEVSDLHVLGLETEKIVGLGRAELSRSDLGILVVTKRGEVTIINKVPNNREFNAVRLNDGDEVRAVFHITHKMKASNKIVMISDEGLATMFALSEIRCSGFGAGTVKGMVTDGTVVGVSLVEKEGKVLTTTYTTIKVTDLAEIPERKRASKGVIITKLKNNDKLLYGCVAPTLVVMKNGKIIKEPTVTKRGAVGEIRDGIGVIAGREV